MKKWFLILQAGVLVSAGIYLALGADAHADASRVLVEKRYWSSDLSKTQPQNTFGPGQTIIASISVSLIDDTTKSVGIIDGLPKDAEIPVRLSGSANLGNCRTSTLEASGDFASDLNKHEASISNVEISQTPKYYCYKFNIPSGFDAKNYAEQTEVKIMDNSLDIVVGNENNYLMIVGTPWGDSMGSPPAVETPGVNGKVPSINTTIDDKLLKESVALKNKDNISLTKYPSFLYQTATGKSSRGGYFTSYPAKITNKSGDAVYGTENFYLFYNPLYYLFGNVFSGGSSTTRAFDFNSRGSTIAKKDGDTNKLNSEATLYNYNFDKNSLIYWDRTNADKNKQMYENINKYITAPRPEIVCDITTSGKSVFASGNFALNNKTCAPASGANGGTLYPNGRVWYFKADPTRDGTSINFNANFQSKGTIIIDFDNYRMGDVPVVNIKKNIPDNVYMGLIVINGGNVVLGDNLAKFNGIIFVPGRL